ncbi:MAG: hypothetical protein ACJ8AI_34390 [Rhodopila sp.]
MTLAAPGFDHLHLNSVDPDAAIEFYTRQFPSTRPGTWAGLPALLSPNNVMLLFSKVDAPPPRQPQSAIWHFGWHVPDVRGRLAQFQARPEVTLKPLYTTGEGGHVWINSDTWPAPKGAAPGLTKPQIAQAKADGVQPAGGGGFVYMGGPDDALVEFVGDHPAERFDHVHLWQEDPYTAVDWYVMHLNATPRPRDEVPAPGSPERQVKRGPDRSWPSLTREGMFRHPRGSVLFGKRRPGLVWQPVGCAARVVTWTVAGPHRAQRLRPRRLGRQTGWRGHYFPGTTVPAGGDAGGDD